VLAQQFIGGRGNPSRASHSITQFEPYSPPRWAVLGAASLAGVSELQLPQSV
jgi:hypothetical protein